MKKYKMKLPVLLLLLLLMVTPLVACFAEETDLSDNRMAPETGLLSSDEVTDPSSAEETAEPKAEIMLEVSFPAQDVVGRHYTEVETALRELGFYNIRLTSDGDKPFDGRVTAVRIGDDSSFVRGDVYSAETPIEICYAEDRRIAVPCADVDCLNLHYTQVEKLFKTAGFTNIQTEGTQVEYNEKVKDGSVVVVAVGEEASFDEAALFEADTPVTIRYRIIKLQETEEATETTKETEAPSGDESTLVWIPTNGGTKYHRHSDCSNMEDPVQVTLNEAQLMGFTSCARCH